MSNPLLDAKYLTVKGKVKERLGQTSDICLTTDAWTSRAGTSYIAVTAHYVCNITWKLEFSLLGCFECGERHTAIHVKNELVNVAQQWEIESKVFCCVTDNAANMVAAINSTNWTHFPCVDHTVNLIVRASIKTVGHTIDKAKSIVEFFNRSSYSNKKFKELQEQMNPDRSSLNLVQDVITRWNSTYDMLARLIKLQEPVEATLGLLHKTEKNLDEDEWLYLPDILMILKPFKQFSDEFLIT